MTTLARFLVVFVFYCWLLLRVTVVECQRSKNVSTELPLEQIKYPSLSDHLGIIARSKHLFKGKTLTVMMIEREPFVIYREALSHNYDHLHPTEHERLMEADLNNYEGVAVELIKELMSIFEFKIRIIRPKDDQFGVIVPGIGWSGLMGSIIRNETDVGVTALSITISRAQVVDFTRAFYVETGTILLRIPAEERNYVAVFEPFSVAVWILLMATILILISLVTVMTGLEERQKEQKLKHQLFKEILKKTPTSSTKATKSISTLDGSNLQTAYKKLTQNLTYEKYLDEVNEKSQIERLGLRERFYYATTCVMNILLIRDIREPPTQNSVRILVCIWWLLTTVIVNVYFGILFGQLVVPRRRKTIETLQELVNQNQVEWGVTIGTVMYDLFKQSAPDTIYGRLGKRMHNISTADEGIRKVIDSNWAYIRERSMLVFKTLNKCKPTNKREMKMAEEHTAAGSCLMQLAKEEFYSVGFGFALAKNSVYLRPFNSAITLLIENGFLARWETMYWPKQSEYTDCKPRPLREGEPLSMKHFISIYLVFFFVVGLGLLVLICQKLAPPKRP